MSDVPVAAGDIIAGKYRIDRVLGHGGMGVVVAATHEQLDQKVAIKFLLPNALANAEVVERFKREARAAVKIQSEHVARVSDVGTLDSGAPYMVMEYLEGSDLAHRIAAGPPLSIADAARFLLEACEALAEAHAIGIVHRDIKPANLFLAKRADKTSSVKVLDFGISKAQVGGQVGGITSTQAVMGSPYYMSPEQLMSAKHVDHRSDIWSLGVVFYEALVGTPPYTGDQLAEIVAKILQGDTPRITPHRPDLPPEVDVIVARCLSKDPNARYQDVGQLATALAKLTTDGARSVDRISRVLGPSVAPPAMTPEPKLTDSRGGTVAMARPSAATPMPSPANTSPAWGTTSAGLPPKRTGIWIAVAGGIALLGVAAIGLALSNRHEKAPEPSAGIAVSAITPNIPAPPPLPSEALTGLAIAASAMPLTTALPNVPSPPVTVAQHPATTTRPVTTASAKPVASAAPTATSVATAAPTSALHMGIK